MATPPSPLSRRERNKQVKLQRIVAAASALFATRGVDEVTTQEIADAADVGTGTLFLYARTKNELLLLVQNAHYRRALTRGARASDRHDDPVEAVMAILGPIITCNRRQADNGRAYLREVTFGDADQPHRGAALAIVQDTEQAVAAVLVRTTGITSDIAPTVAHLVSGSVVLALAGAGVGPGAATDAEIAEEVRQALAVLLDA